MRVIRCAVAVLLSMLFSLQIVSAQPRLMDSLQRIVSLHRGDTIEVNALLGLATEFARKDIHQSKISVHRAYVLAKHIGSPFQLSKVYHWLTVVCQNLGQLDSSRYYLSKFEHLSKDNSKNEKILSNYVTAAGLFYKKQGMYKEALPFMLDALRLAKKFATQESQAGQMLNVGNVYSDMGEIKTAVTYHLQSLKLFEEIGSQRGESFVLQSLGNDYFNLKQFKAAKKYFMRSLYLKQKLKDSRGVMNAHLSLGNLLTKEKDFKRAERYLDGGLKIALEMKLVPEEASFDYALGLLYKELKKPEQSLTKLNHSLVLFKQIGDSVQCAEIRSSMIAATEEAEKQKLKENTLQGTIIANEKSGKKMGTAYAYHNLAEFYASQDQFEKAYLHYRKYDQLTDSLQGDEVLMQISQMEAQYEAEKKEKEIALLRKEQQLNEAQLKIHKDRQLLIGIALFSVIVISGLLVNRYRVINKTRRQLEIEKMRSTIAQDLHDDIGSTLSSINIISKLALQQPNGSSTTHFQRINEQSSKMMESISDIVWSINPNNDSMEQMIFKMKEFAFEILEPKEILFSFEGEESIQALPLDLSKRKNLFLIFKEAVNNAAKHSGASEVKMSFTKNGSDLQVTIVDNGKGFDNDKIRQGNGQRNLKERAQAAGGTLIVDTAPGKGTVLSLSLPLT